MPKRANLARGARPRKPGPRVQLREISVGAMPYLAKLPVTVDLLDPQSKPAYHLR